MKSTIEKLTGIKKILFQNIFQKKGQTHVKVGRHHAQAIAELTGLHSINIQKHMLSIFIRFHC